MTKHRHLSAPSRAHLCFGWQSFDFLDKEGVWLDHDDQGYACGLLHTAHQAWVIHHLRPLAQRRGHFTTAAIRAEKDERECEGDISTSKCTLPFLRQNAINVKLTL